MLFSFPKCNYCAFTMIKCFVKCTSSLNLMAFPIGLKLASLLHRSQTLKEYGVPDAVIRIWHVMNSLFSRELNKDFYENSRIIFFPQLIFNVD